MRSYIHLIRHGITEGNKLRWMYGRADIPLIKEGMDELLEQAAKGIYPSPEGAHIYTSGLLRCEQTLKCIYGDLPHDTFPAFLEIDCGDWECISFKYLEASDERYKAWLHSTDSDDIPMPNGESLNGFRKRIHYGFEAFKNLHFIDVLKLRNHEQEAHSIAIIHGAVITAILYELFGDEEENTFWTWMVKPGRGVTLILEDGAVVGYERI